MSWRLSSVVLFTGLILAAVSLGFDCDSEPEEESGCGDGVCSADEDAISCPEDCYCGGDITAWECVDMIMCVPEAMICDGVQQCYDGSDEWELAGCEACIPADLMECACADGGTGLSTCDPLGAWGACDCTDVCYCDYNSGICEADEIASTTACACDPDCDGGGVPCVDDGHCDTWCPGETDPDCGPCECDYFELVCEAEVDGSVETCGCDIDCAGGLLACSMDGHCDNWCDPDGVCQDADCDGATGTGYLTGECDRT